MKKYLQHQNTFLHSQFTMYSSKSIFFSAFLLLSYFNLSTAFAIAKRSNIDITSSSVTVQWASNGDTINNLRNYHIRKDGTILESGRSSRDQNWNTNALPFKANSKNGGITATVVKLSDQQYDVEIRLFFQAAQSLGTDKHGNERHPMRSVVYKPSVGW